MSLPLTVKLGLLDSFSPPRITLVLPKTGQAAVSDEQLDEYILDIQYDEKEKAHARAKNTFIFTEKERSGKWGATSGSGNRQREKGSSIHLDGI